MRATTVQQPTLRVVSILMGATLLAVAVHYGGLLPGRTAESSAPPDQRFQAMAPGGGAASQPATQDCDPVAVCYRDTARVRVLDHEPGRAVDARWVIFGAAGDSLELTARTDLLLGTVAPGERVGFGISATYATVAGHQERDRSGNTASYARFRLPHDGVVSVDVTADERGFHDTVEYTLQVRWIGRPVAPPRLQVTGQAAPLALMSAHPTDRFIVAPLSSADWSVNPQRWGVFAGRHKVALISDSLYVVCTLPCANPDTVRLKPGRQ